MVWRRLRIAADTSLAALHFIFQIVQGWGGRPSPSISHLWQRLRYLLRRRHRFCR
ncbi:plasmid pRiA4b ORF-3 family protein [Escherichia coli]|uniref:plasmid pRiA4b ORF-3 family protein n=2 Tax=Enterobacteriaceae TaxID=543 RepID=UPI0021D95712|nr:plasmid pRiA4b ORF-3 family protein [Klebsiella pneumoniae]MCQ6644910.1 plasmid pRiA4b ORF-3 family protein [Escherichia coli]MDE5245387.1 plasmid pRiA4b ORF-3 family protein [Klebsiella pneumoniae]MDE5248997.1 plasmid pRiA4b ORF-3 family protein [Klebsiella pneumoniae]